MNNNQNKIELPQIGVWKLIEKDPRPAFWLAVCTLCGNKKVKRKNEFARYTCSCQSYQKRKQTNIEKYGYTSPMQVDEVKQKTRNTIRVKYGNAPLSKPEILQKAKQTNLKKYGVENPQQSSSVRTKTKKTNLERYGVEYPSQATEIKLKQNAFVLSDGSLYSDLYRSHNVPATTAQQVYINYGEQAAIEFCKSYSRNIYSTELAFINLIKDKIPNIEKYDKFPLEFSLNRKPDFRIELNGKVLYLNIDGLRIHSEANSRHAQDKKYHFELQQNFTNNNQTIFQFREDELRDKPSIVKSIVLNYFGVYENKYSARELIFKEISNDEALKFFESNHLMGSHRSARTFALTTKGQQIVSCMSVRLNSKDNSLEIARFGSLKFSLVRGGFSKMLGKMIKLFKPSKVVSFCDMRYSTGRSYELLGFKKAGVTLGWQWTDFKNTFNRLKCRANMDDRGLSEKQHAEELGWFKIYDAGQAKYVLKLNDSPN